MTDSEQRWLDQGQGLSPEWSWSFTADAPLVGLELARESGDTIVADASGSVYILDRRGRIVTLSRGLHELVDVAWADAFVLCSPLGDRHARFGAGIRLPAAHRQRAAPRGIHQRRPACRRGVRARVDDHSIQLRGRDRTSRSCSHGFHAPVRFRQ